MPTYKVVKHRRKLVHEEYLVTADTQKDAIEKVKGGGGIHLHEWDSEEPEDVTCKVVEEIEDVTEV